MEAFVEVAVVGNRGGEVKLPPELGSQGGPVVLQSTSDVVMLIPVLGDFAVELAGCRIP